ncbi:UTRA domain-containing protein [Micromonospora sp. BRA006-A]|nr:UTRA domain-containing protein [Micromonospora sp. BRA006-A]
MAARLGVEPGAPVMRTSYRFLADGDPIQLSVSYEPRALTKGTPVEWPEDGEIKGVVARMDTIGVRVDEVVERVSLRSATASGTPVETADIVLPGGRYDLVYRLPID